MTVGQRSTSAPAVDSLAALVTSRPAPMPEPLVRFALAPADGALVTEGQHVAAGDPLIERVSDATVSEAELGAGEAPPAPGTRLSGSPSPPAKGERRSRFEGHGAVLYTTPAGRIRMALGRHPETVGAPFAGTIDALEPGALTIRADGIGLPGTLAAGQAARGRLVIGVPGPDAELPTTAVDVSIAGAILVAGARLDLEALGRARAMGVRGVVVGGLVSRDLRGFQASEVRQRAAMHGGPPFGLLVLDGYGKRPIPAPVWAALLAARDREVAIAIDPPLLIIGADVTLPGTAKDSVRVAAGEFAGRVGRFLSAAGTEHGAAGVERPMGLVLLDGATPDEPRQERLVPLADLERIA